MSGRAKGRGFGIEKRGGRIRREMMRREWRVKGICEGGGAGEEKSAVV